MAIGEYSALVGKTRAMYGKLLTYDNYKEIMRQKSVGDVVSYLKYNTHYHVVLAGINETDIHRAKFERILRKSLLNDYRKLFCFTNGNVKKFIKIAYLRHEIESFKRLFRVLETEGTTTLVEDSLLFLKRYDTLNISKLSTVHNSQEFISNLKGTVYFDVLRPFLVGNSKFNLFQIEMSLDMYYINMVFSKKKKLLSGLDAKVIERSFGTEIDVLNLLWIYRGRILYNIDRSIILSYFIPHRYKISMDVIYDLVDVESEDKFLQIVANTRYADLFISDDSGFFELKFSDYMYRLHRSLLRKYGFSIACAVSYLHLKEFELSNIISIIEGIRYKMPVETIRTYIIGMSI